MTAASVVCEFFDTAQPFIVEAAGAAIRGENEAEPLRRAIEQIEALASRADDPTEKKDLTTLATALDSVTLREVPLPSTAARTRPSTNAAV